MALTSFKNDFGLPLGKSGFASDKNSQVTSNVVSLLTAGCFFGAIAAAFINDRLGRRYSLMIFTLIFMIGAAVQVAAHHEIGMIYGGRVIAGLGIGGMSSITPVFVSENAPAQYRGRIAGLFQEFLVIGSTFAYWLGYGVSLHMPANTKQWRVPVAIQLIPGGLMFIGLFFLKESSRWLMKQGRREEAVQSLAYIRNAPENSEEVQKEIAEIYAAIEEETAMTEGVTWKECLQKSNRYRFFVAFCIMVCQQFSGTNSIGYYAPQIFQSIGISSSNSSLFATGIYGTVKVIATAIFLFIGIDRWGRKRSLMGGAVWMAVMMFIIGAVLATHPPDTTSTAVSKASIAMVTMIYLYVIGYSFSWGPTPWVYLGEVCFPSFLTFLVTILANLNLFLRFSLLVSAHTVSVSELLLSGCSTSSSPRSLPVLSTALAGRPSSCSASSALLMESLSLFS
jgi:sugar porter (SP) family MFS transporter